MKATEAKAGFFMRPVICVFALLMFLPWAGSALAEDTSSNLISGPSTIATDESLSAMGKKISDIISMRAEANGPPGASQVTLATRQAAVVQAQAADIIRRLEPYESLLQSLRDVLGPVPAAGAPSESQAIIHQREVIGKASVDLENRLKQAKLYLLEAGQLLTSLGQKGTDVQQANLFRYQPALVGAAFWRGLMLERGHLMTSIGNLFSDIGFFIKKAAVASNIWQIFLSLLFIALSVSGVISGRRVCRRVARNIIPEGHLRLSVAAFSYVVVAVILACMAVQIALTALGIVSDVSENDAALFLETLFTQIPVCVLAITLGRGMLSGRNPEWRLLPVTDKAAHFLRNFPYWFGFILLLRGLSRYVSISGEYGPIFVEMTEALFVFASGPLLFSIPRVMSRYPSHERENGIGQLGRSAAMLTACMLSVATFSGYAHLGYVVMSWICSMSLSVLAAVLCWMLVRDFCTTMLTPTGRAGRFLIRLGMSASVISQTSVVFSGLFSVFLFFLLGAVAESGGSFDPEILLGNIRYMLVGQKIGRISLSYDVILQVIIIPVASGYALKIIRKWMKDRLFPVTSLDTGARVSILAIFTYTAWILIGLTMLSVLGITVQSMTWVVSALSVGIGFGLQSIVQNFVSGIILLAERPVTIGDTVEIAGVKGDVKKISVRSTDLSLSDGSTMIVPNSQFITSAVKNRTLGYPLGSVSVLISLPLTLDVARSLQVLEEVVKDAPGLLSEPVPVVSVADIGKDYVSIEATGKTRHPKDVASVQKALRLLMWEALEQKDLMKTS
jgi:small-conductance mechanosensitive channel